MCTFTRNGIKIQYSKFENSEFAPKFEGSSTGYFFEIEVLFRQLSQSMKTDCASSYTN